MSRIGKSIETESRMVVAKGWGRREWGDRRFVVGSFMSIEFQFYKVRRVLEIDGGDDCTTL